MSKISRAKRQSALYDVLTLWNRELSGIEKTMANINKIMVYDDIANQLNENKSIKEISELYGTNENVIKRIVTELEED